MKFWWAAVFLSACGETFPAEKDALDAGVADTSQIPADIDAGPTVDAGPTPDHDAAVEVTDAETECVSDNTVNGFLRCNAKPLLSFDQSAPLDDLAPVAEALVNKNIVMLGESDHGTTEALQARLRLIQFLYYQKGFTEYVMEMGRAGGLRLQRYLETGDESFLETSDFTRTRNYGNTEEFFAHIRALRTMVELRPQGVEPLRIHGMDIEAWPHHNGRDEVLAYLDAIDNVTFSDSIKPKVACVDISRKCQTALWDALNSFDGAETELVRASSLESFELARDVLYGLATSVEVQMRWQAQERPGADQQREELMMLRFDDFVQNARGRVILYAHNMHIAAHFSQANDADPRLWRSVGEHIKAMHGAANVFGIALAYYDGSHFGRDWQTGAFVVEDVPPPPAGYFESYLKQSDTPPRYFLNFATASHADPGSQWLLEPIGVMNGGVPTQLRMSPIENWDAVIFMDKVTAPTPRL